MIKNCGNNGNCIKIELPKDLINIKDCIDYINKHRCNEIWICVDDSADKIRLDFLEMLKDPLSIDVLWLMGNFAFSDIIYKFLELKKLSYDPTDIEPIDLAQFFKLEELTTTNPKSLKNPNKSLIKIYEQYNDGDIVIDVVSKFPFVQELKIHGPKNFSFTDFACRRHLEYISFVNSNIKDLNGIVDFPSLKKISLSYCRSLHSVVGLSKLPSLRTVLIDGCTRLYDLAEIGGISTLRALYLDNMKNRNLSFFEDMRCKQSLECMMLKNCGSIDSVKFLNDCPKLQAFDCLQTNVLDGDLTPLMRLETARASNLRHYNVKRKDLPFGRALYQWF